jgi:hypothetical protein
MDWLGSASALPAITNTSAPLELTQAHGCALLTLISPYSPRVALNPDRALQRQATVMVPSREVHGQTLRSYRCNQR